ncbi:MAG: hypothetical protein M3Q24_00660 [bacterium]|nr:hypothetical protein [bacterium]
MFSIKRSEANPILSPNENNRWESLAVFNPTVVKKGKDYHMFYRAMSTPDILEEHHMSLSVIGKTTSKNGTDFIDRKPFIIPENDFERFGCEDPRITFLDGTHYIFYTALSNYPFNADGIKVAVAKSKDLKKIDSKHLVTPFNAKAMTMFPEKINGKFAVMLAVNTDRPPSKIGLALFEKENDLWSTDYWNEWYKDLDNHTINISKDENEQIEVGCQPIKTDYGWLLIYSHIENYFSDNKMFGIRAVLLDIDNPRKVIGELKQAFMVPEAYYEKVGMVPNIIFPSSALVIKDDLVIYYGATDTHCGKATVNLEAFLASLLSTKKGLFKRSKNNPILTSRPGKEWEDRGVFNPAAIEIDGKIHMVYRAMSSDDTGTFGYAQSNDGEVFFERSEDPTYVPRQDFEKKYHPGNSGCEDPRLINIDGSIYMFYTAFDGSTPRIAATSISDKDFVNKKWNKWTLPEIITPGDFSNKDGCLIPEKTDKGYVMIHRVNESICADIFETLDFSKEKVNKCIEIISPRRGMWDHLKVGLAAPPIKTKKGWLMLYHGVSNFKIYKIGAVLLDLKDPTLVLARTALPIFEPEEVYEKEGIIPNVVFPCGLIRRKEKLLVYYGGADTVVGLATVKISELLKTLS